MTYKDFYREDVLDELFNKVYDYVKHINVDSGYRVEDFEFSTTHGELYTVTFDWEKFKDRFSGDDMIDMVKGRGYGMDEDIINLSFHKMAGRSGGRLFTISSSEDFVSVFATVLHIIKREIRDDQPLFFSAKEPSRIKLYDRMSKKFKRSNDELLVKRNRYGDMIYLLLPKKGVSI